MPRKKKTTMDRVLESLNKMKQDKRNRGINLGLKISPYKIEVYSGSRWNTWGTFFFKGEKEGEGFRADSFTMSNGSLRSRIIMSEDPVLIKFVETNG